MTRLGITFKDVEITAEEILAAGENPTIERVRWVLGTGSNSTIAKYLQEWRAIRLLASKHDSAIQNTAPDAVNAAVTQVWEKIRNEAANEIKAVQENAQSEIELAQRERDDAIKARELMQQELDILNKRFNQISAEREIVLLDLKALQREQGLLQEQYKHLEGQYQVFKTDAQNKATVMMANHQTEIVNKNSEIANIKEAHDKTLNKLVEAYENNRQDHMLEVDNFKTENLSNKKTIEHLESAMQNQQKELIELRANLTLVVNERDSLVTTSTLRDDIIKNHHEVKENTQLTLTEIKKLQYSNTNDLQSFWSQLQQSMNNLEFMSKAILNSLTKQKELAESE
jgi:hypothetical protein